METVTTQELKYPIYIPQQGTEPEFIELDGESLPANVYDVIELLRVETAARDRWLAVACAYDRCGRRDCAITILEQATSEVVDGMLSGNSEEKDAGSRIKALTALAGAYVMEAAEEKGNSGRRREFLTKAAGALSRAEKINFDDPSVLAGKGWREFVAGNAGLSGQWFDNAKAGNSLSGMLGLAAVQLNQADGKPSDTVRLLKAALRDSKCPPGAWIALGHALHKAGEDDAAKKSLQRAWLAADEGTNADKLDALVSLAAIEASSGQEDRIRNSFAALTYAYTHCEGGRDARVLSQLAEMFYFGGDGARAELLARKAVAVAEQATGNSQGEVFAKFGRALIASATFQLGRAQHLLGKRSLAEESYTRAISSSDPQSQESIYLVALLKLGLLRLSSDNDVGATDCFEKLLKIKPDCWLANRALGVIIGRRPKLVQKEKIRAYELLQKGILQDPDGFKDVPALLSFAQLLTESSPEEALKMYSHALEASAETGLSLPHAVHNNIAALHARRGNLKLAERHIALLKKQAEDPAVCLTLSFNEARLAERDGRSKEAKEMYDKILETCPEYLDAKVRLGCMAMAEGNMETAEKFFNAGLESPSEAVRGNALCYKAELLKASNRDQDLQRLIEPEAIKSGYGALAMSQFLYERLGNVEESRRPKMLSWIAGNLMACLRRMPNNAFAANAIGVYLAHEKNMADAREAFAAAGACGTAARINLAHAQVEIGRRSKSKPPNLALLEQATKLYSDALQEDIGDKPYVMLCQARACFEATKFREAASILRKVLEAMPSSQGVMFNLGLALQESALSRSSMRTRTLKEMRVVEKEFGDSRECFVKLERMKHVAKDRFVHAVIDPRVAHEHSKFLHQRMRTHKVALLNIEAEEEEANAERRRKEQRRLEREENAKRERELQAKREELRRQQMEQAALQAAEKLKRAHEAKAEVKKEPRVVDDDEEIAYEEEHEKPKTRPRKRKRQKVSLRSQAAVKDESSEGYSDLEDMEDDENMDYKIRKRSRFTIAEDDENEEERNEKDARVKEEGLANRVDEGATDLQDSSESNAMKVEVAQEEGRANAVGPEVVAASGNEEEQIDAMDVEATRTNGEKRGDEDIEMEKAAGNEKGNEQDGIISVSLKEESKETSSDHDNNDANSEKSSGKAGGKELSVPPPPPLAL